jgi:glutamine synthetase
LQVIHDAYDRDGAPIPTAPRNVLKRVVQLFRDKGLEPVVAPEMEFFLVARNTDPAQPIVPMMGRSGRPAAAHQAYSLSLLMNMARLSTIFMTLLRPKDLKLTALPKRAARVRLRSICAMVIR